MDPLKLFQHSAASERFHAGETIFREGEPGSVMYVVKRGRVEISVEDIAVTIVETGGLVGEMALIDAESRSATATARSDCELVPVDDKQFEFLVQQTPYFALHVMRVLVERLRETNRLLAVRRGAH